MRLLGTLLYFIIGAAVGAAAGALVASMLAPQNGDDLKIKIRERIDEGRKARDQAEIETTEAMKQRFRNKVGDPDAMNAHTS